MSSTTPEERISMAISFDQDTMRALFSLWFMDFQIALTRDHGGYRCTYSGHGRSGHASGPSVEGAIRAACLQVLENAAPKPPQ